MRERVATAHDALLTACALLERENGDVQDIEFTVQKGRLFLLQARSAKRSPEAAARIAVEMVGEGLIDIDTALARVSPEQAAAILLPRLDASAAAGATLLLKGEGACPGVASGIAVADPDEAEHRAEAGEDVILIRETTSPDDIHGMIAARGIVTAQGGATSHAAVVSRALGRPCVVGGGAEVMALAGRMITIDGSGTVYADRLAVTGPDERADPVLARLIAWADERSPVAVVADDSGVDGIDVDHLVDAIEGDALERALAGHSKARGRLLAAPLAARAAHAAGVTTIVTQPALPALLAILSDHRAKPV